MLTEILKARKSRMLYLKCWTQQKKPKNVKKKKKYQAVLLFPDVLFFKNKGEIKTYPGKKKFLHSFPVNLPIKWEKDLPNLSKDEI